MCIILLNSSIPNHKRRNFSVASMKKPTIENETMASFIDAVITLRKSIKQYFQQKIKEMDNPDITYEMFQVLVVLWKTNRVNQQEIANNVQKGKASLTPLIDNLVNINLVTRTEDPADRRNKIIALTKNGLEYQKKFAPMINEFYSLLKAEKAEEQIKKTTQLLIEMSGYITGA